MASETGAQASRQWTVGHYSVLGRIARGGTSNVLLAYPRDRPQAPRVVLKRLYSHLAENEDFVHMFVDEVRLMSLLHHRGVVSVYDLDDDGESFFAVLELVDGPSVAAALRLRDDGVFPAEAAVAVAARVAEALHVVHELVDPDRGEPLHIVHRDVAPANVLLGVDAGGRGVVKIGDFGVARSTAGRRSGLLSARDTQAGLRKGRASTMSPEQVMGRDIDRRTDLWALGVTLWTMLVGAPPFRSDDEAHLLDAITHAPTPRLSEARAAAGLQRDPLVARIAPRLELLLTQLLAKDKVARPSTAAVVADELRALVPAEREDDVVATLVRSLGLPSLRGESASPDNHGAR